jgi:hypothetical protein
LSIAINLNRHLNNPTHIRVAIMTLERDTYGWDRHSDMWLEKLPRNVFHFLVPFPRSPYELRHEVQFVTFLPE